MQEMGRVRGRREKIWLHSSKSSSAAVGSSSPRYYSSFQSPVFRSVARWTLDAAAELTTYRLVVDLIGQHSACSQLQMTPKRLVTLPIT